MLHSFVLRKILFEYLKEVHPRVDCSGIYCTGASECATAFMISRRMLS
jgi:hypothetical protein